MAHELLERFRLDEEFALDVLDLALRKFATTDQAQELEVVLAEGGSAWKVALEESGDARLERRVPGPAAETIDLVASDSGRTAQHLDLAWRKLFGRDPDTSGSYREAVRAVEVAAKPLFTPDDSRATLGKIIRAIRDKPEKWELGLDGSSALQVAEMADLIWRGQKDRHGTDDPEAPLAVSREEADAALFLAIALARLLTNGTVKATEPRGA